MRSLVVCLVCLVALLFSIVNSIKASEAIFYDDPDAISSFQTSISQIRVTNTWDGSSSTAWGTSGNWSQGHAPLATEDAVIPSGVPRFPVVTTTTAVCQSLTINSSATLTISTGTLTVSTNLTSNGVLALSDAAGNLIVQQDLYFDSGSTVNATANGEIYVTRHIEFRVGSNINMGNGAIITDGGIQSNIRVYETAAVYHFRSEKTTTATNTNISSASDHVLTIKGDLTIGSTSKLISGYTGTVILQGDLNVMSGGICQLNSGTFSFEGNTDTTIDLYNTDNFLKNVTINKTTGYKAILNWHLVIKANLLIQSGTFQPWDPESDYSIYIAGNWTNNVGTTGFSGSNSTVEFNGTTDQTLSAETFGSLEINNIGHSIIASGTLDINSSLAIDAGTLVAPAQINIAGNWTNNVGTAGFTEGTGNVTFDGAGNQIVSTETFHKITMNKSDGQLMINTGSAVTCADYEWVAGGYTVNGGAFTCTDDSENLPWGNITLISGTITYEVVYSFEISAWWQPWNITIQNGVFNFCQNVLDIGEVVYFYNIHTLSMSGGTLNIPNLVVSVGEFSPMNENITGGIINCRAIIVEQNNFTPTGSTIVCSYAQTAIGSNLHNLEIVGPAINWIAPRLDVNGNMTISSGVFYAPDTLYVGQNWTNNVGSAGFTEGTGIVVFDTNEETHINSVNPETFYHLVISKVDNHVYADVNINVSGDFNLISGFFNAPALMAVSGNWNNVAGPLWFIEGTGTVTLDGSSSGTISAETFNNLEIYKGDGYSATMTANLDINGNLTIHEGDLSALSYTISLAGNWFHPSNYNGHFVFGTGTVIFDGDNNTICESESFYNIVINKSPGNNVSGSDQFSLEIFNDFAITSGSYYAHNNISIYGNWTNNVGTAGFNEHIGTVYFWGSGSKTVNSETFYHLVINKTESGTVTATGTMDINGNFYIEGGQFVAPASMTVAGNWTNNVGTSRTDGFIEGTGRVTIDGSADQTLSSEDFNILELNKSGGRMIIPTMSMVTCNSYDWTAGAFTVSGGSFIIEDLADENLDGTINLTSGMIEIHQDNEYANFAIAADISISNGEFHVYCDVGYLSVQFGGQAYLPTFNMSGGVFDVHCTLLIDDMYENITGGVIRCENDFTMFGVVTDINFTGGTVELYGSMDGSIRSVLSNNSLNNLLINKSGAKIEYYCGNHSLVLTGDLIVQNGTLEGDNDSFTTNQIQISGSFLTLTGPGSFIPYRTKIVFNGNGIKTTNIESFYKIDINKTGGGSVTATENLRIYHDYALGSELSIIGGQFIAPDSIFIAGDWSNTVGTAGFTEGIGSVTFDGAGATTVTAETFYNLIINKSVGGTLTALGDLDVNNDFTLNGGVFTAPANMSVGGDWINNVGTSRTDGFIEGNGVVCFDGTGTQTVSSEDFYNLVVQKDSGDLIIPSGVNVTCDVFINLSNSAARIVVNGGNLLINWTTDNVYGFKLLSGAVEIYYLDNIVLPAPLFVTGLEIQSGTFDIYSIDLVYLGGTPDFPVIISGGVLDVHAPGLIMSGFDASRNMSNGTIRTNGNLSLDCFSPTGGTVEMYGGGTSRSLDILYQPNNLYNLLINVDSLTTVTTTGLLDINGDFTLNSGIFVTIDTMLVAGNWTVYSAAEFDEGTGLVVFDGNTSINLQEGNFANLTIDKNTGCSVTCLGNLIVNGNLTIDAGQLIAPAVITVAGNWTNNVGTSRTDGFIEGTGTVIFNGTGDQTVTSEVFNILELNKSGGNLIVPAGAIVSCNSYDWTAGTYVVSGGSFTADDLADPGIFGTIQLVSGSIEYHQDAGQLIDMLADVTIYDGEFDVYSYGVSVQSEFSKTGNPASLTMSNGTLNMHNIAIVINGDLTESITGGEIKTESHFYVNHGSFNPSGGTIVLDPAIDVFISNTAGSNLFNLFLQTSSSDFEVTCNNDLDINGNLTIEAHTLVAPSLINIAGNWTNLVGIEGFAEGTGTVAFDGSSSINLPAETFYSLTINKNSGKSVTAIGNLSINGNLTIDSGIFNAPDTIFVTGNWTNNVGTTGFNAGTGSVMFNGDGTKTVSAETFNNLIINKNTGGSVSGNGTLEIKGSFTIDSGQFIAPSIINVSGDWLNNLDPTAFVEGNGKVVLKGTTNIYNTENFYTLEFGGALLVHSDAVVTCMNYTYLPFTDPMKSGSLSVYDNSIFTAQYLSQNNILGRFYAHNTATINLRQRPGCPVDLYGTNSRLMTYGGTINVMGGINESHWATLGSNVKVSIQGYGTIAFHDASVIIQDNIGQFEFEGTIGGTLKALGFEEYIVMTNPIFLDLNLELIGTGNKLLKMFHPSIQDLIISKNPGNSITSEDINPWRDLIVNSGVFTIQNNETVSAGNVIINGGTVNANNSIINVSRNWTNFAGESAYNEGTGTVNFDGTSFDGTLSAGSFYNLVINKPGRKITTSGNLGIGNEVTINGGKLEIIGTETTPLAVSHSGGTSHFEFNVESGGILAAEYAVFEYMDTLGVNIKNGAVVDTLHCLNSCTFRNGAAGGTLLTVNNGQDLTISGAVFPANTWGGSYNVTKTADQGSATFIYESGDFSGEDYDNDLYDRIDWTPANVLLPVEDLTISYNTVTGYVQLDWTYPVPVDRFKIYRCDTPDGVYTEAGTTSGTSWSETTPGMQYFYYVTAFNE